MVALCKELAAGVPHDTVEQRLRMDLDTADGGASAFVDMGRFALRLLRQQPDTQEKPVVAAGLAIQCLKEARKAQQRLAGPGTTPPESDEEGFLAHLRQLDDSRNGSHGMQSVYSAAGMLEHLKSYGPLSKLAKRRDDGRLDWRSDVKWLKCRLDITVPSPAGALHLRVLRVAQDEFECSTFATTTSNWDQAPPSLPADDATPRGLAPGGRSGHESGMRTLFVTLRERSEDVLLYVICRELAAGVSTEVVKGHLRMGLGKSERSASAFVDTCQFSLRLFHQQPETDERLVIGARLALQYLSEAYKAEQKLEGALAGPPESDEEAFLARLRQLELAPFKVDRFEKAYSAEGALDHLKSYGPLSELASCRADGRLGWQPRQSWNKSQIDIIISREVVQSPTGVADGQTTRELTIRRIGVDQFGCQVGSICTDWN